jgi:hypothetical protein
LSSIPVNPFNGKSDIESAAQPVGEEAAAWQADAVSGKVTAGDSAVHAGL